MTSTNNNYEDKYNDFTINFARYFLNYLDEYQTATTTLVETYMCKKDYCPCVAIDNTTTRYPDGFSNPPILQTGSYATFDKCYADLLNDGRIDQPVSSPMLKIIKYLEDKYTCSSVCESTVPDFGFYRDINQSRITKSCGGDVQRLINRTLGILSILLLVTCLFLFLAFNA